ncbi:MAG: GntR family transcriptional regulator [Defluviitaleaceae bacterium]|nr:GntR family transcriptional regulator [Defluviitaleaceae bacterium]
MRIIISNRSGVPIYEQIKEQIKSAIFAGVLVEDDVLPSVRQLAKDLKVSVITTTRAYSDLDAEGFVTSVPGKGSFVLPRNKELAKENAFHKIEEGLNNAIIAARSEGIDKKEVEARLNLLWDIGNEEKDD